MVELQTIDEPFMSGVNVEAEVESDSPRRVSILGVHITDVTKRTAMALMERPLRAARGECHAFYIVNAHTLNLAADDPHYRDVLNQADFVFNDGTGVRWAARQRGIELRNNLNGTDLIPEFLAATGGRGYRYFMLGATRDTIRDAAIFARQRFSGWTLAGFHHGYVHDEGGDAVIDQINAAGADLLLVGMGNPIQERWIHEHRSRLHISLAVGVGGMFDHWAGNLERAPVWVRRAGCEWLHLLIQQPFKWRRYLLGNPRFLYRMTSALKEDLAQMNT
ncbi:MAG: WecB/TagA/CpsF family glycosyltransferase [Planctomycetia bacterium]|nr:WecB/TagA/CpsF family glycosyltransferase [Planctomycetia bacterium]